ncbi:MAG: dihydrofolate reductase, partial [Idiomarina sp.]|nr:dihydrofolate reductase [Idiomarina sp.]
ESIGRPLPGRHNIVLTRQPVDLPAGVSVAASVEQALTLAGAEDEVMIIGGGEIYRQFLPLATRLYITEIDLVVDGDTRFPDYQTDQSPNWSKTLLRAEPAENSGAPGYRAFLLEKQE